MGDILALTQFIYALIGDLAVFYNKLLQFFTVLRVCDGVEGFISDLFVAHTQVKPFKLLTVLAFHKFLHSFVVNRCVVQVDVLDVFE